MSDPQRQHRPTPAGHVPGPVTPESLRLIIDCGQTVIYRQAQRFLVRSLAGISAAFGVALLLGGGRRFDAATPTFTYAAAVPGSFHTWGYAALTLGVFTFVASFHWHRRAVMWGLLGQCVLFAFFTVSIAVSAAQDPTTPYTGIVIYGGYSLICTIAYVAGHELRKAETGVG